MKNIKIIGVAGTFGSGKDTIADHLEKNMNFFHISTGDLVREESMKRHGSIERNPYLQETATYLRRKFGGDILIKRGLEKLEKQPEQFEGIVFTGLRSLGEARGVKKAGGYLLFVDAPVKTRFARMKNRQRDKEVEMTLEQFKASEQNEQTTSDDEAEFNIYRIKDEADEVVINDSDLDSFIKKAEKVLFGQI